MARPLLMHLVPSREALFGLFRHQPTEAEKDRAQDHRTRDALAQARAKAHADLGVRAAELKAARDCRPHGCGVEAEPINPPTEES